MKSNKINNIKFLILKLESVERFTCSLTLFTHNSSSTTLNWSLADPTGLNSSVTTESGDRGSHRDVTVNY